MSDLKLTDFLLLREEIHSLIDLLSQRGFSLDDTSNMDFQKIRYKRLVRLYNTLDSCILDLLDDEAEDPVEVFPNNSENIVNYRSYDTIFENHYRSWFKDCSSHELVKQEDILCNVIRQIKCGLIPQIKNDFLRYAEALQSRLVAAISAHCFM